MSLVLQGRAVNYALVLQGGALYCVTNATERGPTLCHYYYREEPYKMLLMLQERALHNVTSNPGRGPTLYH